ncbi:hypothetical protein B566_EDAN005090 [Ephemera danica]|nr:hypothetical protein B566_EDAN005090 [Ephemera danica]
MERQFMSISELTQAGSVAGPICGRVISRTGFKTYNKPGEPGEAEQMSTLILRDRTGEIKIVLFAEIARHLFGAFQLNHCYEIENFKIEEKRNTQYDDGPFSLIVTSSTRFTFSACDSEYMSLIPRNDFRKLTLISDIANLREFDTVDVLGVCVRKGDVRQVAVRGGAGRKEWIRKIWVADESGKRVKVTLWTDDEVSAIEMANQDPIYFSNLRVNYFNEELELKSDMTSSFWMVYENPNDVPEERVEALMTWRDTGGFDQQLQEMRRENIVI